jgi:hypothetical protein
MPSVDYTDSKKDYMNQQVSSQIDKRLLRIRLYEEVLIHAD